MRSFLVLAICFSFVTGAHAADKVSERVREFVEGIASETRMEHHDNLVLEFVTANASTLNLEEFLFLEKNVKMYAVIKEILQLALVRQKNSESVIRILKVSQKSLPQSEQMLIEVSAATFLAAYSNDTSPEQCLDVVRTMTMYSPIQTALISCGEKAGLTYKQLVKIIKTAHQIFEYAQDKIEEIENLAVRFIENNKASLSFVECMRLNEVVKYYRVKDNINVACKTLSK